MTLKRSLSDLNRLWLALLVPFALLSPILADDWPQWLGPQRDGVWRETGVLDSFPAEGLKIQWRHPIGGGYAGPAVARGKVYVADRQLAQGAANPNNPFERGKIPGKERLLCLDETSGETVWLHEYDCAYSVSYPSGPRATPLISGGKVYSLGAEGDLYCLDAGDGRVIWHRRLTEDYSIPTPMWGFAAHPLLDGDRLICMVGGEGSTVVAFDKDNGKEIWKGLTAKEPGYCPPTLIEAGGTRQLIVWDAEAIHSLNPLTGKEYWSHPWDIRSGMSIATPRILGDKLFFSCFYNGSAMFQLDAGEPKAELLWKTQKASEKDTVYLHTVMSTPVLKDGHIYGTCSYGQLRCLRMSDGKRLWETMKATTAGQPFRWANAFFVQHENRHFLFNEMGDLILADLKPDGYHEIDRVHLIEPTGFTGGRDYVWSHPAFANRHIIVRNDKEILRASLARE